MSSFDPGFGARVLAPDRTRFRLWAPGRRAAGVVLDGGAPLPMTAQGGGWFECEAACGAGARYRYRFDDPADGAALEVADPASNLQDGDVDGPSVVVDQCAYRWRCADWRGRPWHETVLYEMHVGLLGGYAAATRRLPELAALGITAVELMPLADFPGPRNWGYDGALPYAPDTAYGSPDELKQLIDRAHELGMMVFLDVVYNHFGPDGNYLGAYAPPFFRSDVHTPWGVAIDFRVPEVRDFFCENALYWLSCYRFDGLRFDAAHAILEQDFLPELARRVRAGVDADRHVHLVLEHDGNAAHLLGQGFDAQWNDDGHHALHVMLSGERDGYYADYAANPAAALARCLEQGFFYQGQPSVHRGGAPRGEPSAQLAPTAFVLFLQNHDQVGNRAYGERLASLAGEEALRAASALLLLTPQIPMLFMGEEYGERAPFLYFTSYRDPALARAVLEGRRAEFARFAKFSGDDARATISDPNAPDSFEKSKLQTDAAQALRWREWTGALLQTRRIHLMPRLPGTRALGAVALGPLAVGARWRMGDGAHLALALNLGAQAVALAGPLLAELAGPDGTVLCDSAGSAQALADAVLPPFGFVAVFTPAGTGQ